MRGIVILGLALLLGGCGSAQVWMPDDGVAANPRAFDQCRYESDLATPVLYQHRFEDALAAGIDKGTNQSRLIGECMQAEGYHLEFIDQKTVADEHHDELVQAMQHSCSLGSQDACATARALQAH